MEAEIKQKIELYKQEAESQASPECCCPGCQEEGSAYRAHDRRRRQFYVIVGNWVQRFFTTLIRWKCVLCGTTFTFYPSFCVPYKRFVLADPSGIIKTFVIWLRYNQDIQQKYLQG